MDRKYNSKRNSNFLELESSSHGDSTVYLCLANSHLLYAKDGQLSSDDLDLSCQIHIYGLTDSSYAHFETGSNSQLKNFSWEQMETPSHFCVCAYVPSFFAASKGSCGNSGSHLQTGMSKRLRETMIGSFQKAGWRVFVAHPPSTSDLFFTLHVGTGTPKCYTPIKTYLELH